MDRAFSLKFRVLISQEYLKACTKLHRNALSTTCFLINFAHWTTNLTIDDIIIQERAIVFSLSHSNFIVLLSTITVQNFKSIG